MPKETFFNLKPEKRERILRSAVAAFNEHGFTEANIGAIAQSAGVAKGSMYQYFEDKRELFIYCVTWSLEYLMEKIKTRMGSGEYDLFEYYSTDISLGIELVKEERDLAFFAQDVFLGKFKTMPEDSIKEMQRVSDDYILEMIKVGQEKGNLRRDIDENLLKLFLSGVVLKIKEYVLKEAEAFGFDITDERMMGYKAVVEDMIDMLKNGIGNKEV
jgi:AcrR family transcriptional regulator